MQPKGKATVNWNYKAVEHKEYTDLGKYVIDFGVIDQDGLERGRLLVNSKIDNLASPACTGIVKHNSKGEVIMGRNQDLELSNYPVFIAHYVGGKYEALSFYYNNYGLIRYDEYQKGVELPKNFREITAAASCDAFNEAGLYIQADMRTAKGHMSSGTKPGAKRVCMGTLAVFISQNAATVKEALEYLNTLDIYSPGASDDGQARAEWDGGYMIGDATGEYGVIEFANNKMYYTPYANGHANYYVHPLLATCNTYCCGHGRLAMGLESMVNAETEEDMMEAIHKADWRRIIEDIHYSHRDKNGNPCFVDKDGNPSIDYRAELPECFAVGDDGHYIPEKVPVTDLMNPANIEQILKDFGKDGLAKYMHNHANCTQDWLMNPDNFEEVKQAMIDFFTLNNAFELLEEYKQGKEKNIRDKGDIFTTAMNFGINCAKKHLIVRFLEDRQAVYEYQW